jgi:hypothetical protein
MVDSCLQVLVKQRLEFFILLVEQTSIFNQILSVHQQTVVLAECIVEGPPHTLLLLIQHSSHLLPENTLFPLNALLLLILSLKIGSLFHPRVAHQLSIVGTLLSFMVELLQDVHNFIHIKIQCIIVWLVLLGFEIRRLVVLRWKVIR